jgi:hypothetical protein
MSGMTNPVSGTANLPSGTANLPSGTTNLVSGTATFATAGHVSCPAPRLLHQAPQICRLAWQSWQRAIEVSNFGSGAIRALQTPATGSFRAVSTRGEGPCKSTRRRARRFALTLPLESSILSRLDSGRRTR